MRIMQLGKAAAYPDSRDWNVSYLIDMDGGYLLIEAPPSIANQLNRAGVTVSDIDWIYISHRHGDHILGLPILLVEQYARRSDKLINIVVQEDLADVVRQLPLLVYPELESYMNEHVRITVLNESNHFSTPLTQGFVLKASAGSHGVPSMAIRVQDKNNAIVYSGDTAGTDAITNLATDADVLIHEAGAASQEMRSRKKRNHATPAEAGAIAARANCRQLWLTHLDRSSPDFITSCVNEAMSAFEGDISVVPDFQWITI